MWITWIFVGQESHLVLPYVHLEKMHMRVASCFIWHKMRTAAWDSSEKLLQRVRGDCQYIYDFGNGEVHAIKFRFFFYRKFLSLVKLLLVIAQVSTAPSSSSLFQRYNIQHQLRPDTQAAVQSYFHCKPEPGSEQASLLASASSGRKGAYILLWWVGSWCREWRAKLCVSHVSRGD